MPPKISFVISYYRKEKSIAKCLRSLFNQSIKDFEVIVVMDGPDKEGEAIIRRFKKVTKLVILPENKGAPAARNEGAKYATGEFISFWDADCYIEPGAAAVWLQIFEKFPEADFVYSGYRFPEGYGGISSESFDPWMLKINNYISGMFPIRRAKAPVWDETLKSLQDWDFWLKAVEAGCKGFFSRGYAFKTDLPDAKSISGQGCTDENWLDRLETVKKKHNIAMPTSCVTSVGGRDEAIRLAKLLDADFRDFPTSRPNRYTEIIQIGWDPQSSRECAENFVNRQGPKIRTILFWRAQDVYTLRYHAAVAATDALAKLLNASVTLQFCEDHATKEALQKLGFNAVVLPLPLDFGEEKPAPLPPAFRVLVDVDPGYKVVFESVKRAMPDIEFKDFVGSVSSDDFSALVRFQNDRCIDLVTKKMLMSGRRVISNIQSPFCGYVDGEIVSVDAARTELIKAIRAIQDDKELNLDAMAYYQNICSPGKFKLALAAACGVKEQVAI